MTPYLILPLLIVLSSCFLFHDVEEPRATLRKKSFLFITAAILLLFVGLRNISVGDDTSIYVDFYLETTERDFFDFGKLTGEVLEPGFLLWMKLISLITPDPRVFLMMTAIVTICPLWWSIFKLADNPFFVVLLFVFLLPIGLYQFMSLMRQGMACGLLALSLTFLVEKRKLPFFVCVLLAGTVHWFAFLFLIGGVVFYIKPIPRNYVRLCLIAVMGCLVALPFAESLVSLFMPKYLYYFENNYNSEQVLGIGSLIILTLEAFVIIGNYLRITTAEKEDATLYLCYGVMMCLAFVFLVQMPLFGIYERCAKYFMFFLPFAASSACSRIEAKSVRIFSEGIILSMAVVYYLYNLWTGYNGLVPYLIL